MAKRKSKGKAAVIDTGAYDYKTLRIRGKDGRIHYSRGNADAVAKAMLLHIAGGGTLEQVIKANKLEVDIAGAANAGQARMTVGGVLRAAIRAGETVKIGSIIVKSFKQHVDIPKVEAIDPSRRKKTKSVNTKKKPTRRTRRRDVPAPVESPQPEAA